MSEATRPVVLIVEDDSRIRRLMTIMLRARDCDVRDAGSAREGLAAIGAGMPAVAILDVRLPDMDGVRLCSTLKGLQGAPWVVMVSAHGMPADVARARDAGCDDYIVKPFDEQQLLAAVDRGIALTRQGC